ncbi:MAG: hypothetical protein JWP45_751 [Mucilaginibacter sp.]|nr:hypothetical protein [Mucilaginibacter sp.]
MNLSVDFAQAAFVDACIIRIYSFAICLTSLEYFAIIKQFGKEGIYSWEMMRLNVSHKFNELGAHYFFNKTGVIVILLARMICGIYLLVIPNSIISGCALALIVITSLMLSIRNTIGNDGSDQMSVILGISLLISAVFKDIRIKELSLYFIATQSILSYVIAGIAKLASKKWRSGIAVFQIMNTESFGSKKVAGYLKVAHPIAGVITAWHIMTVEALFFMVLFLPYPYMLIFLFWGVSFHFYNAVVMGLNNFFWVFIATYPAIIYTNLILHVFFK